MYRPQIRSRKLEMRWRGMMVQLTTTTPTAKTFMVKVRPERMVKDNKIGREGTMRREKSRRDMKWRRTKGRWRGIR